MQRIKKLTALILSIITLSSVFVFGGTISASASGTGAGLAEWALNAYYEGWEYVYGGTSYGSVDCSGLIYLYCGGSRCDMYYTATESGSVSAGIPRVHGLGLYHPGHVGVYIGDGMAVDARSDYDDMCYQSVSSYGGWYYWFKLAACTYPENGWEKFNGEYYYYENGEYIVNTSRTIDGTTYYFDSKGVSSSTPSSTSSSSSSSGSSSSSSSTSKPEYTAYRNGSTGSEVTKIQERLAELGYYTGEISGTFDDATEAAYRAFQTQAGVYVDGVSGSDREVLYSDDAPYAPVEETTAPVEETTVAEDDSTLYKLGDESEDVKKIQEQLTKLGYFDVEITGTFGDYTEQVVKNFQLANGLLATGVIDEETYAVLFADDTEMNPDYVPESTEATEATTQPGPIQMPVTTTPADLIVANEQNQTYTDNASQVVKKTNTVTKRVLSKSSSVIPSATTAQVKRTANIWLWFVLVAVIMGALAGVYFLRDKKARRYARYTARKKKRMAKADVNARW